MKKKNLFVVAALAITTFGFSVESAMAQELSNKNHYYELKFGDNMYVSAAGNLNVFMNGKIPGVSKSSPITIGGSLGVGKWLTPYVGLRLEFDAAPLKQWNPNSEGDYIKKSLGYFATYGDLTWNLSNTFWGYKEDRLFSVIPFAGISYITTIKKNIYNKTTFDFPMSAGVKFNFCLTEFVDAFAQGRFTFTSGTFDGGVGRHQLEPLFTASVGVSVKFGKNRFFAYNPYEEMMKLRALNAKVNELRKELDICNARKCPEPKPCPDCPPCQITSVVRFRINSALISREEQVNVYNAAQWMKQHTTAIVEVVGYADKKTGTSEYNLDLSMRRAQAVANELIKKYGIDSKRIKVIAKGSMEQPYPEHNDWNRVVLFVTEK